MRNVWPNTALEPGQKSEIGYQTSMRVFMPLRYSNSLYSVVLLLLFGFGTCADGKELGLSDLQGTWKLMYQEIGGKKLPDEKTAEMFHGKMVFKGSDIRYSVELPSFDFGFSYVLHSDQQPTGIDLKLTKSSDDKGVGRMMPGICRLDGDKLEICYGTAKRPADFSAAKGTDNTLIVLKKE